MVEINIDGVTWPLEVGPRAGVMVDPAAPTLAAIEMALFAAEARAAATIGDWLAALEG